MSKLLNGWKRTVLGELSKTTSGGTPSRKRKDYYDGTIPWVKSGELNDGYIENTDEHISEIGLKNSSAKLFSPGTLLIALYGATVGKTSLLRTSAATNQAVCGITPSAILNTEYLRYHLVFLRPKLLGHRYGGAQPNISQQIIRNLEVDYPPLPEQKKIAHILTTVKRAIDVQERIIQVTTELKKALMHKLFTEGLRNEPQKQTEIGPVPESWEVRKLGNIAKTISKGSSPKWQGFHYTDSGILFVRSQNVGDGKMLLEERAYLPAEFNKKEKRSILQSGDILINLVGASIGRVALGTDEINGGNCNQAVAFVRLDGSLCLNQLIVYFLLSPWGQEQMRRQKKDIARANLSLLDVSGFKIPIPRTEEEIEEVASTLVSLEQKISTHERKRDQLQELFRSLLHDLMSAKTRVHSLNLI